MAHADQCLTIAKTTIAKTMGHESMYPFKHPPGVAPALHLGPPNFHGPVYIGPISYNGPAFYCSTVLLVLSSVLMCLPVLVQSLLGAANNENLHRVSLGSQIPQFLLFGALQKQQNTFLNYFYSVLCRTDSTHSLLPFIWCSAETAEQGL